MSMNNPIAEEVKAMTEDEIDAYLISAGIDPEKAAERIGEALNAALAAAWLNASHGWIRFETYPHRDGRLWRRFDGKTDETLGYLKDRHIVRLAKLMGWNRPC